LSPLLGLSWMDRNSSNRPHPSLIAPDHDVFDGCLGSGLNSASICYLISQPELLSTPAPTVLSPISPSTPSPATVFAKCSSSPPIIVRQPIVAGVLPL
jgi:hypothetical protein